MKENAQFNLELILPFVNHLKDVINQDLRIERRKEQMGWTREQQDKSIFDEELNYVRERERGLEDARISGMYSSNGDLI